MKNTYFSFLVSILLTALLIGCDYNTTYEKQEQTVTDETEESMEAAETTETITDILDIATHVISDVELNNTYTTRYGEVNLITYPAFSIDYPDGWTITSEDVSPTEEKVVLTNDAGITVTYWYFGTLRDLNGPLRRIDGVNVTRMADASFIPGYVQATDYSDLGTFMVAKLETTSECDLLAGGESVNIENGRVRYALLPESEAGEQSEYFKAGMPTFSFWYSGHISLIANTPNSGFTEQEEREVIAILASFREDGAVSEQYTDASSNPIAEHIYPNAATTIDELWAKLEGVWVFEEYIYLNKSMDYTDHTLEFQYVNNMPCMRRTCDNGYFPDVFFYDFDAVDESDYNAYIYKRGSYNGNESANWGDDMQLVWYSFDLSNISDGELSIGYHLRFSDGFIDDHIFRYRMEK